MQFSCTHMMNTNMAINMFLAILTILWSLLVVTHCFHCYEYRKPGFYRHPSICKAFYQCNKDGTQVLRYCAKGMNFRVTGLGLGYCDITGNALCTDNNKDDSRDTVIFNCPKDTLYKLIDGHFPNPMHCNKFFLCVDGISYEMNCPIGFEWAPTVGYCDMPYRAGCRPHYNQDTSIKDASSEEGGFSEEEESPYGGGELARDRLTSGDSQLET